MSITVLPQPVSFAAQQTFLAGLGQIALSEADINGDGKPDLVVVDGTLTVLLNTTPAGLNSSGVTQFDTSSLGVGTHTIKAVYTGDDNYVSSNATASEPERDAVGPEDLATTVYHQLGVDPATMFQDSLGRPVPMLPEGRPIQELLG